MSEEDHNLLPMDELAKRLRMAKKEVSENRRLVKRYLAMNMSRREIAAAVGIHEDNLDFYC